jgi:hypothetical protein
MSALIPYPLYRVYEKFITAKVQKQETFLVMQSYPLSHGERVRVRGFRGVHGAAKPLPPALSRGEREL